MQDLYTILNENKGHMGKKITVGEGHTESIKTDRRNGKQTTVQHGVEIRPVMDGFHNETLRDKFYFGRDFVTLFKDDLYYLITDKKDPLSLWEFRVFFYLCSTLDRGNITITNAEAIAEDLNMRRESISRTLTKLKKRNLVIEQKLPYQRGEGPRTKLYAVNIAQLNYNVVFNGQIKDYKKVRFNHPQLTTTDGETLLNPHAEAQRQKLLREQQERESLFPEFFQEEEEVSPDVQDPHADPDTGEVLQ